MNQMDIKEELATQAAAVAQTEKGTVRMKKDTSIPYILNALGPELKKSLPSVMTP